MLKRLRSKTYWLGFATFILGLLETAQATGTMPDLFDGQTKAGITLGISIGIFVLRELTHKPVSEK